MSVIVITRKRSEFTALPQTNRTSVAYRTDRLVRSMVNLTTRKNHIVQHIVNDAESASPLIQRRIDVLDADDARAAENIAEWRKYLPQDCIETMIKRGWHRTA